MIPLNQPPSSYYDSQVLQFFYYPNKEECLNYLLSNQWQGARKPHADWQFLSLVKF